jgi:hypothetical protein
MSILKFTETALLVNFENGGKMSFIEHEFDNQQNHNWFFRKEKKFLHNIDTFYYSVSFVNDFMKDSADPYVKKFRIDMQKLADTEAIDINIDWTLPGLEDMQLTYSNRSFAGYYNNCISCPDTFDIFIATRVPTDVTSEILVQLRSKPLWLQGVNAAFEYSMRVIFAIEKYYHLHIHEVKENRIDYCWHTNYLQSPEKYLRIDNFCQMQVSRYKRINYQYQFKPNNEYENDYISLGKRNDKCFVRMYLKTKEVIEQGYKPWFINEWYYNQLISRYDYYVLSNLYELRNWKYLDIVRLQFYAEYGSNVFFIEKCNEYMHELATKGTVNFDSVQKLADKLTPRITIVMNVEFQTTRKGTKSYCLIKHERNKKYGVCKRIYDYLDNRRMITEYLTHDTLRLVDVTTDSNKSRCDYTNFWKALRRTKQVDVKKSKVPEKLHREYSRKLDYNLMKKRYIHSAISFSLYGKGINNDDVEKDFLDNLVMLNDNDIHHAMNYKYKRSRQLNQKDFDGSIIDE